MQNYTSNLTNNVFLATKMDIVNIVYPRNNIYKIFYSKSFIVLPEDDLINFLFDIIFNAILIRI